jgi:hypothetical protein
MECDRFGAEVIGCGTRTIGAGRMRVERAARAGGQDARDPSSGEAFAGRVLFILLTDLLQFALSKSRSDPNQEY